MNYYHSVKVNQIDESQRVKEIVWIDSRSAHVNIVIDNDPNFKSLDDYDKNLIRLDIINKGLLRLTEHDPRFTKDIFEKIHNTILENRFQIELKAPLRISSFDPNIAARFMIILSAKFFDYFITVENNGMQVCKTHLYRGKHRCPTSTIFFQNSLGKRKNN